MTGGNGGVGRYQLADFLGVSEGMVTQAWELRLLPEPDGDGRWPEVVAADLRGRWPQIAAAVELARELGAVRSAELLARVTGLPITAADIAELEKQGMLRASRCYLRRPLYRVADVQALADDGGTRERLTAIVARRHGNGEFG
jgi:hypothetical protein